MIAAIIQTLSQVVVELGTGYFCEKEVPEAVKLIDRKTQLINSSIESVESVSQLCCHLVVSVVLVSYICTCYFPFVA